MSKITRKINKLNSKLLVSKNRSEKSAIKKEVKKLEQDLRKEKLLKIKSSPSYVKMKNKQSELRKQKQKIKRERESLEKKGKSTLKFDEKLKRIEEKIFKKSDKYFFLQRNKKHLQNRRLYLVNKIVDGDNFDKKTYWQVKDEIQSINDEIIQLNSIMDLPIREINNEKGIIETTPDFDMDQDFDEVLPWQLVEEVNNQISLREYKTIKIYGIYGEEIIIKYPEEKLTLIKEMNKLVSDMDQVRLKKNLSTPKVRVLYDNENKEIIISA